MVVVSSSVCHAQFQCTFSGGKDAADCTAATDDSQEHCAWCSLSSSSGSMENTILSPKDFGFCVSESQAEAMESSIPNIHCDRYSGKTDDSVPSSDDDRAPRSDDDSPQGDDDQAPDDDQEPAVDDYNPSPSDDQSPPSDDEAPPDDDRTPIPDNYWSCLQKKNAADCSAKMSNCTWCDTKGGFGLCLTGPTAESAEHSAWFTCHTHNTTTTTITTTTQTSSSSYSGTESSILSLQLFVMEPTASSTTSSSCVAAFVTSPTQRGCVSTMDAATGTPCEWCSLYDLTSVCLTAQQAEMGAPFGISCDNGDQQNQQQQQQNVDADSIATLDSSSPYDPTCFLSYLDGATKEACVSAKDANGNGCKYCSLQGIDALNLCLNEEQATQADPLGIQCDVSGSSSSAAATVVADPYDQSCMLIYLVDQSEAACVAANDVDGNVCEYCNLQGAGLTMCLTAEQATLTESVGVSCAAAAANLLLDMPKDPYDPSCLLAYLEDSSQQACVAAVDADGNNCEFCTLQGALDLCLTAEQAEMGEQAVGMTCEEQSLEVASVVADAEEDPYDPSCLLAYLEDSSEEACVTAVDADGNACEFCTLQGALDLCLTEEQAAMGEETLGITCSNTGDKRIKTLQDPYDPSCLMAYLEDSSKDSCVAAVGEDGNACEFCTLQGALDVCLTVDQAEMGEQILGITCDSQVGGRYHNALRTGSLETALA